VSRSHSDDRGWRGHESTGSREGSTKREPIASGVEG
jgi:hypothetical protein